MYDHDVFIPKVPDEKIGTDTYQFGSRHAGGMRSFIERLRLMALRMPETWLLDVVMLLTLVGAGIAIWRNWPQMCAMVISASAWLVYLLVAVIGLLLLLRLLLPRRWFRH